MSHIPIARTKTIMKTTDGADAISKEAVLLTSRATELFIRELALAGYKDMEKNAQALLGYNNLVNVVHRDNKYAFLEYMIPRKITVMEYKELMRKKDAGSSEESEEESTTNESGSGETGSASSSESGGEQK